MAKKIIASYFALLYPVSLRRFLRGDRPARETNGTTGKGSDNGLHPRNRAAADQGDSRVLPGSHVKVHYRIKEGNRERIQVFEGDVIRRHGSSNRETFTVRKVSFGVGVERTFPVHSPKIEKIEVVRHGAVRRAKLYYLRDKVGKAARLREKGF